jgi:exodeoxyribonuclease VII small subunit
MADESHSFSTARTRLEDIVSQVRKKDTSLEKSLDLLEEGVRLANACTELIDRQDWTSGVVPVGAAEPGAEVIEGAEAIAESAGAPVVEADAAPAAGEVEATATELDSAAETDEVPQFDPAPEFFDADDVWADESEPVTAEGSDDPSMAEG